MDQGLNLGERVIHTVMRIDYGYFLGGITKTHSPIRTRS